MKVKVKGYILASSYASPKERKIIDRINRSGGVRRIVQEVKITGGLTMGFLGVFIVAWTPVMLLVGLVGALIFGTLFFLRGSKTLQPIMQRVWLTTDNPDLMALDREWQAAIAREPDEAWHPSLDQQRYVLVRQLAEMTPDEAAPLIAEERARLNPVNP